MEKTIEIPEGYEARIGGNKVILERKESEDERIRKDIIAFLQSMNCHCVPTQDWDLRNRWLPYLERQKEGNLVDKKYVQEAFNKGMQAGMKQQPAEWSEEGTLVCSKFCKHWHFCLDRKLDRLCPDKEY